MNGENINGGVSSPKFLHVVKCPQEECKGMGKKMSLKEVLASIGT